MADKHGNHNSGRNRRDFMRDGAVAAAGVAVGLSAGTSDARQSRSGRAAVSNTRSYNPEMKYTPMGRTGEWVSKVCLGGHWKRIDKMVPGVFKDGKKWLSADLDMEAFQKNRYEVVSQCIKRGINYIDACTWQECVAYGRALKGRRDSVFLGFSWYQEEMRNAKFRTAKALLQTLDKGMKEAGLDYVDVWRITMISQSSRHTEAEVAEMMEGLERSQKQGKVRFTGLSSHDRPHIKKLIEQYPKTVQVVCTPFTAKSKVAPEESVFDAVKKHGVAMFGIKPFSSNRLFKGDSSPGNPQEAEDDRLARMTIRYILAQNVITAPIPGMINAHQVDNVAKAVTEGPLAKEEADELELEMDRAWANLPAHYEWLKNWEYV